MTIEQFFKAYAREFEMGNTQALVEYYSEPSMDMCGDATTMLQSQQDITDYLQQIIQQCTAMGMAKLSAKMQTQMSLADDITFCVVRWTLESADGATLMVTPTSYTLKCKQGEPCKIIASVREQLGVQA